MRGSKLDSNQWTPERLNRKFASSAISLGVRQVLVHGSNVLGSLLLARMLSPAEFGLYAIATFSLTFLSIFGGTGFAANLIRQAGEPSTVEYRAVFSAQLLIVLFLTAVLWAASPLIASLYHLTSNGTWLFRLIALSLLTTSFMVIPQVQLERHLAFSKLALVEVAQSVAFNVLAVFGAWYGWGVLSFGLAMLLRSMTGAILANLINPWPLRWQWSMAHVLPHLGFAFSFQGTQFISMLKDSILPVFVGLLLGTAAVGYVNWANVLAAYSLMALMIFQRIYLPAFARLQHEPAALARFVERILLLTNGLAAPVAVLVLVLIRPITEIVFGDKWLPAIPVFYFLWGANIFAPSATPLLSLLSALGRPQIAFRFSLLWMVGTWILGVPLIMAYGAIGFAFSNLAVQLSAFLLYAVAMRVVPFRMLPAVGPPWVAALVSGATVFVLKRAYPVTGLWALVFYMLIGFVLYISLIYLKFRKDFGSSFNLGGQA